MPNLSIMQWTLITGILSALATGLGAGVALFVRKNSHTANAFANAYAAGMMLSASIFSLIHEALSIHSPHAMLQIIGGILLGALFLHAMKHVLHLDHEHDDAPTLQNPSSLLKLNPRSLLLFTALFIHSMPEGVAIGVGFATQNVDFGLLMALMIAIHNIPEGIAMSLPMRAQGASTVQAAVVATLTSLPQPLLAVPALLLFDVLSPLLPLGLGFASGAMLFIVFEELLPEAMEAREPGSSSISWGILFGVITMLSMHLLPAP